MNFAERNDIPLSHRLLERDIFTLYLILAFDYTVVIIRNDVGYITSNFILKIRTNKLMQELTSDCRFFTSLCSSCFASFSSVFFTWTDAFYVKYTRKTIINNIHTLSKYWKGERGKKREEERKEERGRERKREEERGRERGREREEREMGGGRPPISLPGQPKFYSSVTNFSSPLHPPRCDFSVHYFLELVLKISLQSRTKSISTCGKTQLPVLSVLNCSP